MGLWSDIHEPRVSALVNGGRRLNAPDMNGDLAFGSVDSHSVSSHIASVDALGDRESGGFEDDTFFDGQPRPIGDRDGGDSWDYPFEMDDDADRAAVLLDDDMPVGWRQSLADIYDDVDGAFNPFLVDTDDYIAVFDARWNELHS